MFNKNTLKKMKKDELIEIILMLQNNSQEPKTLFETLDKTSRCVVFYKTNRYNRKKTRVEYVLNSGDFVEIYTEDIAPSGYAYSGTRFLIDSYYLEDKLKLDTYEKLKARGWNRNTIENFLRKFEN